MVYFGPGRPRCRLRSIAIEMIGRNFKLGQRLNGKEQRRQRNQSHQSRDYEPAHSGSHRSHGFADRALDPCFPRVSSQRPARKGILSKSGFAGNGERMKIALIRMNF